MPGKVRFFCPHCSEPLWAPTECYGVQSRCRACRTIITVPNEPPPVILVLCTKCGFSKRCLGIFRGHKVRCPNCPNEFRVPSDNPPATSFRGGIIYSAADMKVFKIIIEKALCPHCGFVFGKPPKRRRQCPKCKVELLVRHGIPVTFEEAKRMDMESGAWFTNTITPDERRKAMRQQQVRQLEDWKKGGVLRVEFMTTEGCCLYCATWQHKIVPMSKITPDMLPPFAGCLHEKVCKNHRDQGCRCWFQAVLEW